MCVSHLVRGDAVHEGEEWPALIAVARQSRQHRETHLLGYVVRRSEVSFLPTHSGAAVPHHQGSDGSQDALDRPRITLNGSADRRVQSVPRCGHRSELPRCYLWVRLRGRHRTGPVSFRFGDAYGTSRLKSSHKAGPPALPCPGHGKHRVPCRFCLERGVRAQVGVRRRALGGSRVPRPAHDPARRACGTAGERASSRCPRTGRARARSVRCSCPSPCRAAPATPGR